MTVYLDVVANEVKQSLYLVNNTLKIKIHLYYNF